MERKTRSCIEKCCANIANVRASCDLNKYSSKLATEPKLNGEGEKVGDEKKVVARKKKVERNCAKVHDFFFGSTPRRRSNLIAFVLSKCHCGKRLNNRLGMLINAQKKKIGAKKSALEFLRLISDFYELLTHFVVINSIDYDAQRYKTYN